MRASPLTVLATATALMSTQAGALKLTKEITTVVGVSSAEHIVKKSRFLASCYHAPGQKDFKNVLENLHAEHPKARHICWAWTGIGTESRFDDDGEPGGTAGRPILASIQGEALSETLVCVVRYFGGIKLGTGGLVRAYGSAARLSIEAAEREVKLPTSNLAVQVPQSMVGTVYAAARSTGAEALEEVYKGAEVVVTVKLKSSEVQEFTARVGDATRGVARIEEVDL
ncbi:unnamed protein product [Chrysoparadoxa australica]